MVHTSAKSYPSAQRQLCSDLTGSMFRSGEMSTKEIVDLQSSHLRQNNYCACASTKLSYGSGWRNEWVCFEIYFYNEAQHIYDGNETLIIFYVKYWYYYMFLSVFFSGGKCHLPGLPVSHWHQLPLLQLWLPTLWWRWGYPIIAVATHSVMKVRIFIVVATYSEMQVRIPNHSCGYPLCDEGEDTQS